MKYVACVKWGKKYGPEYVNKLFRMVRRNASSDITFVCFTDNGDGVDERVQIWELPYPELTGWWNKVALFSSNLPISGTVLFLDLDVVIIGSIDDLFEFLPNNFVILQGFAERINKNSFSSYGRKLINRVKGTSIFNSSVFRFDTRNDYMIWEQFLDNRGEIEKTLAGDQDWISQCVRHNAKTWPYTWCMSYKWEIAGYFDKDRPPHFYNPRKKRIPSDCKIIVFHGTPNPEDVMDIPIIKNNYC